MYFKIYGGDICHVIACGSIRANSSKFEDRLRKLVLGFYHYHIGFQRKYATLDFNLLSWLELFTRYLCNVFLAQLWGPKQPRKSRDPNKVWLSNFDMPVCNSRPLDIESISIYAQQKFFWADYCIFFQFFPTP